MGEVGVEEEGKRDICLVHVHVSVRTWCAPRAQHQGANRRSQVCPESRCSAWGHPLGSEPFCVMLHCGDSRLQPEARKECI